MSGARMGLMYPVLWARLDRMQLSATQWQDLYDDLRAMERAGLEQMAEQARAEAEARKAAGKG